MRVTISERKSILGEVFQLLAVLVLLLFMEQVLLLVPIRAFGETAIAPLQQLAVTGVRELSRPLDVVNQRYAQVERIKDLEHRHAEALSQLAQVPQLKKENEELRRLLNQPAAMSQQRVITTPIVSLSRPIIAGGSLQGVPNGALVLAADTLLGIVDTVSPQQATVQLLSRQQERVILAQTASGIEGVIRSDGKRIILDELPRESVVAEGESIVTVGQEGIPSGLLVGTVGSIQNRVTAPVLSVVVLQATSFYETPVVEVVW